MQCNLQFSLLRSNTNWEHNDCRGGSKCLKFEFGVAILGTSYKRQLSVPGEVSMPTTRKLPQLLPRGVARCAIFYQGSLLSPQLLLLNCSYVLQVYDDYKAAYYKHRIPIALSQKLV